MKNNKVLIIAGVILLDILVAFMIGQSLLGKDSHYEVTVAEARSLAEQELCSKSIAKYEEALLIQDSLDTRIEMISVYEKGLDIGEFTNVYDVNYIVKTMVDSYRKDPKAYEEACKFLIKYSQYQECADILMQARDLHVVSDAIEDYRNQVRYQYTEYFSMYTDVLPSFNGMYTVKTDEGYTFLNDEGSPQLDGTFDKASSFSEEYAFIQTLHPDGETKSIIINKDGERQAYLDGVESSSGVGRAKDADGNDCWLLSCKVGETYKYYTVDGKVAFGEYAFAGRFRNNVAAVKEADGAWRLIDGTGKAITDITFTDVVLNEFDECAAKGFMFAQLDGQYHLYDLKVTQIGDFSCDGAKAFVDDYAAFMKNDKWGFVDTEGHILINPQYDDAKSFSNKMGAVKLGDVWQFINPENQVVIDEVFEDANYLNDKGICFVKSDGYWSYLKMYYTGQ